MSISWTFKEAGPGDRARESQVEKFFNSDAVANRANAIVREGIQNSLDAAPDDGAVRVRIAIGKWDAEKKQSRLSVYTNGFIDHFAVEAVQAKVANPPSVDEDFRYLLFEDFGTSGLVGDPSQWWPDEHGQANPFFNYFRAEGISDKSEGSRGRHGVGRLVFMFASRIRSMFGFTHRGDGEQLLMGTSVLRNHWLNQKPYQPDGWFGDKSPEDSRLTLPVRDDVFISEFKSDFGIARMDENGLSVIVPWLGMDVTISAVIEAVISGYFYPILRRSLTVEVVDEGDASVVIDAESIESISNLQAVEFAIAMKPVLALAQASLKDETCIELLSPLNNIAPRWSIECIPETARSDIHRQLENGELLHLRAPMFTKPKGKPAAKCHFDLFIRRDPTATEGQIIFIREGIIISDVRPRRTAGIRAVIIVDAGPLATFLGDSENPSHTQWQKELVHGRYTHHAATIDYVVNSVPSILAIISDQQKNPDTSLLIDLFSLPSEEESSHKTRKKKTRKKGEEESEDDEFDFPRTPKRFAVSEISDGFVVRPGDATSARPPFAAVKIAYGVRRGSAFAKYDPADFRIGLGGIKFTDKRGCNLKEFDNNYLLVELTDDDFEFSVTGFDVNRDLHIDVKAKEMEVVDATAS